MERRTISAGFLPDELEKLEAIRAYLEQERPGVTVNLADSVRFCVNATAMNLGIEAEKITRFDQAG